MPPKLRRLSGRQVITILNRFGFEAISQRSSHVKLSRITPRGEKQILTVPVHDELDLGTLHAIFAQASRFIPQADLRPHFYTE